jgi:hypothetical protein
MGSCLLLVCLTDMKTAHQPHSKRLSEAVQLGNDAWRTGIAVGSDASAQGYATQDHDNDSTWTLTIYTSSLFMYPLL